MELSNTPIGSPILIGLTIGYFVTSAISTFDTRLIQAKRTGTVPEGDLSLPQWVGVIVFLDWGLALSLLLLNWKYAAVVFVARFVLRVLPVLETAGNILMAPFAPRERANAGTSSTSDVVTDISDVNERPQLSRTCACLKCGRAVEIGASEITEGRYCCPGCGARNIVPSPTKDHLYTCYYCGERALLEGEDFDKTENICPHCDKPCTVDPKKVEIQEK